MHAISNPDSSFFSPTGAAAIQVPVEPPLPVLDSSVALPPPGMPQQGPRYVPASSPTVLDIGHDVGASLQPFPPSGSAVLQHAL